MQINDAAAEECDFLNMFIVMGFKLMNSLFRAIVFVSVLIVAMPVLAAENWPDGFSDYVANVRKTIKTVDMDGYLATVRNPNGAMLIDVREDDEYKAGHVPGLISIPRGLLEFRIWRAMGYPDKLDVNRKIVVQCRTGGRATLAAASLKAIGFTDVTAVIMNIEEWEKKGHPWEK